MEEITYKIQQEDSGTQTIRLCSDEWENVKKMVRNFFGVVILD